MHSNLFSLRRKCGKGSPGFPHEIYLQQRVGEGGGSIRCRASSGEPTQEAPEIQGKVEEHFMNILTKLIVNVNELKRGTKVPAKFIIIYSSEHVMISSLLLHNSRSDH